MSEVQNKASFRAAVCYTGISVVAALAFAVAASLQGRYTTTAIYGGAAWVFLLSMIVTMPLVIPAFKKRNMVLRDGGK